MRRTARHLGWRAALAALLTLGALGAPRPALATDLESVRARAQRVADEVTALEHRLERLRVRSETLEERISRSSQRIGLLAIEIGETEAQLRAARRRYVRRAVEAYKEGPTSELALLLSAGDISALLDAAEAVSRAADQDSGALRDMLGALRQHERTQEEIDRHKQELLAAEAANAAVAEEIEAALAERRAALAELQGEIARLERQARLQAARAAAPSAAFAALLESSGPAQEIPAGYVGTGVVFEGIASWYGPGFAGEATASGEIFDPDLYTAASRDLPFGTLLFVQHEGRGVVVVINDRGPYLEERILDLSRAAAEAIGLGLGWVTAEILVPARA